MFVEVDGAEYDDGEVDYLSQEPVVERRAFRRLGADQHQRNHADNADDIVFEVLELTLFLLHR